MSKKPFVTKEKLEERRSSKNIRHRFTSMMKKAFVKMQKLYRRHLHGIRDFVSILR